LAFFPSQSGLPFLAKVLAVAIFPHRKYDPVLNYAKVSVAIKVCPALTASSSWSKAKIVGKLIPWGPAPKWMGGSSLEPPIGVAVKGAFYDVRYPGIVIHPSVVWFVGLKFQRITIQ
jgi:hypothetical protein